MSNKKMVEIFKSELPHSPILKIGKSVNSSSPIKGGNDHPIKNPVKVVVFDLDETLGSFSDLFLLWSGIKHIHADFQDFSVLLDLYPEFLRCNIIYILQYLYQKKMDKICNKVYIYTNNQCQSREWVYLIMDYFNNKVSSSCSCSKSKEVVLFDKVISAFKIGNKHIELSRTTHEKTHSDLMNSTMLPLNTEICFIDDTEYIQMKQEKVYYICPKAYTHSLSISEIIERFIHSNIIFDSSFTKMEKSNYELLTSFTYWKHWFSMNNRSSSSLSLKQNTNNELNIMASKKIMYYIREFFL